MLNSVNVIETTSNSPLYSATGNWSALWATHIDMPEGFRLTFPVDPFLLASLSLLLEPSHVLASRPPNHPGDVRASHTPVLACMEELCELDVPF